MSLRRLVCLIGFVALVVVPTGATIGGPGGTAGGDAHSGMWLDWSIPGPGPTHSDIAFWGDVGVAGDYDGFRVFNRQTHQLYVSYRCRGPQNDVSLWRYNGRLLLFMSVDRPQIDGATVCGQSSATDTTAGDPRGWEGIRIFDITNPASPAYLKAVTTDCGSHTHTIVPDLANNRLLLYVSSFPIASQNIGGTCQQPFGKFSIVSVPLDAPETASVIAQPPISAPPWNGAVACHDITVFTAIHKAAASCMSEGQIWDISDPVHPDTLHPIHIDNSSVWFWHSAEFTWDGQYVVFDDEGTGSCSPSGNGRIWIYRVSDGLFQSSYMIPRPQGGAYCSVHNGNFIPMLGRYQLVTAWYGGGTGVIDLTNPTAPREIAYYDASVGGSADTWSSYWYNGSIYANDIARGIDAFKVVRPSNAGVTWDHLNAQTQESLLDLPVPRPAFG